jgi:hypothetical protein
VEKQATWRNRQHCAQDNERRLTEQKNIT